MTVLRMAALTAALCFFASVAQAQKQCPVQDGDCSYTIPAGGVQQMTLGAASGYGTHYMRITAPQTVRLWCTATPGVTPAANGGGSYPIQPGLGEEYPLPGGSTYVPLPPIFCTPESGSASGAVRVH